MDGQTSLPMVPGPICRVSAMDGVPPSMRVGLRTRWDAGAGIRRSVTPGFRMSLGAGCRITTATGSSIPCLDGRGSRDLSAFGHPHWLLGIKAPDGSGGLPRPQLFRLRGVVVSL